MPKNKGKVRLLRHLGVLACASWPLVALWSRTLKLMLAMSCSCPMQGGKNRRRGKNEGEEKRELIQKEEGQGERHSSSVTDLSLPRREKRLFGNCGLIGRPHCNSDGALCRSSIVSE